ncbi:tetratricopeptide repeat protein [Halomonas binhaiensis]|uniref:Sel1 repeat family protein n=1 Tax=Halomonas binhaiensis TaxID=2562282 RepID=A0A856QNP0_9GAMM|nr:tetratricopeptide repeat protein [Halomonas binhaiensis]QEM81533.2 sel1 repeat family protein [Halomonas binhaiensis]
MSLQYIFRKIFILLFFLYTPLSMAGVLYENPIENGPGHDLFETSFHELLTDVERKPVDESVIKAQYLLGLVYMNGSSNWDVDRDIEKSIKYLLSAWSNEVADSGYTLARIYYNGAGVEKDNQTALEYLQKSAEMGFLISQQALGKAYLGEDEWEGLVSQDIPRGICWLEKAGNAGDLESSITLAYLYWQGELVEEDDEAALQWMLKGFSSKYGVSDSGDAGARLAEFYEKGIGTEIDLVQAYKYYDLQGTAGLDDKARLAEEMTQDQIDEAIRLSREWQEKHNTFVPSYDGLEHQPDGSYR